MNQKSCALLILSLTSILAGPSFADSLAATHKHNTAHTKQLPALAGAATVTTSSQTASALTSTTTIPLLTGISDASPEDSTSGDTSSSGPQDLSKTMNAGESDIIEFKGISTSAVGDPSVADITPLSANRLLISAKGTGHTTIFVYDKNGKNTVSVTVLPSENMSVLASKIEDDIGIPTVTVRAINDTIFLEGSAPTQSASALAAAIAGAYSSKVVNLIVTSDMTRELSEAERYADLLNDNLGAAGITAKAFDEHTLILTGKYAMPTGQTATLNQGADFIGDDTPVFKQAETIDPFKQLLSSLPSELKVINLVNISGGEKQKQVLVRAKVVDIDRSSTKTLGLTWGTANEQITPGTATTPASETMTFNPQPVIFSQVLGINNSTIPGGAGIPGNYTNLLGGGGPITRLLPWATELSALITEGKARVLSEPSMMVLDGNEGSILVGGEFPVPINQGGASNAITVVFKPFGIRLTVDPTVVSEDTIQMTVTPEVSTVDASLGVQVDGTVVPGVSIRRATSTLQMKDGQTLVIGGLYSEDDTKNINKIPVLSQIPILGEFFKNTTTGKEEHELLVMIEAEIVTPDTLGATPPPADSLENMDIHKPYVPRKEFNQDFPDLENGTFHHDPEAPKVPVALPPGTGQ